MLFTDSVIRELEGLEKEPYPMGEEYVGFGGHNDQVDEVIWVINFTVHVNTT